MAARRPASDRPAPSCVLAIENAQRCRRISRAGLERFTQQVVAHLGRDTDLVIHLISSRRMATLNQQYLQHEGSTDILTFDLGSTAARIQGELYISLPDAVRQADEFGTDWPQELGRYVIHGLLHLCGYDDLAAGPRRIMKREEDRLVRLLDAEVGCASLAGPHPTRVRRTPSRRPAPPHG
jgi:probable rRNA maturation factor